jgi:thiol-disulfide isomerase/thioredoxin
MKKVSAHEFPPRLTWLNSDALRMKKLQGKVVLLDFWTYSCVNCIRTQPHLNEWHEKYADKGLVIIGIHTPEFDFEKVEKNVQAAVKKFKIKYPIVLDPDYKIWKLYSNRWWPRKLVIDKSGAVIYDHVGEGGYAETEHAIQKALKEIGYEELPVIEPDASVGGGICYRTTPETYLGFLHGRYGNLERFIPKQEHIFTDVNDGREDDLVYLHGHFQVEGEYLEHTKKLSMPSEYLAIKYSAFSVNAVMESTVGRSAAIFVELDGQPLPEDMAGEDIKFENGKAVLKITQSRMYRIVDSDTYHKGVLKLKTANSGLRFFAFTFGGCRSV